MSDKIDKATGKIKEVAGKATGNEDLADEGREEQAEAEAREAVKKAGDHLGAAADKARDIYDK